MPRVSVMLLILSLLAACASDPPSDNGRRSYGPPTNFQGMGPDTGMRGFTGTSNWGPGTESFHPATPGGNFRGF